MSIFDDLGKRISKAGGNAVERTKQRTEISRINARIKAENKKIAESYRQIGEMFVKEFGDDAPEDFQIYIRQIDTARGNIEKLKEDINTVKGIRKCPNCGNEIKITDAYCSYCGEKMEDDYQDMESEDDAKRQEPQEHIETKICPACGSVIKGDAQDCPACGEKIEK